jgi:hypothetical protein
LLINEFLVHLWRTRPRHFQDLGSASFIYYNTTISQQKQLLTLRPFCQSTQRNASHASQEQRTETTSLRELRSPNKKEEAFFHSFRLSATG